MSARIFDRIVLGGHRLPHSSIFFRNGVMIRPVFDSEGELARFLGSQVDLGTSPSSAFVERQSIAAKCVAKLPRRQLQVLEAMANGLLNKQIAMRIVNSLTLVLLIIGGANWGLLGLFGFDLVATLFGEMSALSQIVYALVGAAALWQLIPLFGAASTSSRAAA